MSTGPIGNSNQYLQIGGVVSAPAYSFASDNDSGMYRIGANNIGLGVNGAKVLDIATTGLGITGVATGTSTSANALAVGRQGATNPVLNVDASTASVVTGLNIKGAAAAAGLALSVTSSGTNENLTIDAKGTGTITLNGTATGTVTVNTNFGIGCTPNSTYLLDVGAGAVTDATAVRLNGGSNSGKGSYIAFSRAGTAKGYIGTSDVLGGGGDDIAVLATNNLRFYTAGNEVGRFDTSGNFGIGASPLSTSISTRKDLTINGSSTGGIISFGSGGVRKGYILNDGTDSQYVNESTGVIKVIAGSLGVQLANGGTSWTSLSDEEVKTFTNDITDAAAKVSSLRAKIGYYNRDENQTLHPFLVAQDVQKVLPEAITVYSNFSEPLDPMNGKLLLSYTEVIPLLVAAIKELTNRLAILEIK